MLENACTALVVVGPLALAQAVSAQDLGQVYPATLEHDDDDPEPLDWTCSPGDVWRLSAFEFEFEKQLQIKLRASTLVVGQHDGNALWAVVLPDRPAKLDSTLGGDGEAIRHVWMRFHPSRIGELFPERTVRGNGPPDARLDAYNIYAFKVEDFWSRGYEEPEEGKTRELFFGQRPVVPPRGVVVLDMDTVDGKRRVFSVDTDTGLAKFRAAYLTRPVPEPPELDRRQASASFERAVAIADELMAAGLKPELEDWDEHVKACRRGLGRETNAFAVAAAIHALLTPLDGDCLRLRAGEVLVPGVVHDGDPNASVRGIQEILSEWKRTDSGTWHGRTPYGVGYVMVTDLTDDDDVEALDGLLDDCAEDWGLILDLRFALDGDAERVERFAGRFFKEATPYGMHVVWKEGVGEETPLEVEPRGPWTFDGVVGALIGPATSGEAERLAMIVQAMPRGMTMGARTSGHGVGAGWEELAPGLSLYHRKGLTLDTAGLPVPMDGLEPGTPIEVEWSAFTSKMDPLLYKALEEIYLTPHPERRKAKSGEQWWSPEEAKKTE